MAAPQGKAQEEAPQGTLFIEPGTEYDQAASSETPPAETEPPAIDPVEYERALSERAELRANLEAERARVDHFLAQPPASPYVAPPEPASVAMPDPAADPEAFGRWLQEDQTRRESALRSEMEQRTEQITASNQATVLWQDFCRRNPHLQDLESYARTEFLDLTNQTGIIPNDTETFMTAIKERLEKKCNRRPNTPPTRTGFVSGGSDPKPRPTPAPKEEESEGTIVDEIKDWQAKSGLYG